MKKTLDDKALIFIGPGGVGKTTSAIVFALHAAFHGKRVGLLSIDPSKRLAAALGIKLDGTLQNLELGNEFSGTLKAGIIDLKKIFDDKVRDFTRSKKNTDRVLNHPLYVAASTNLAGPLEYMSLAKFQDMYDSGDYDIIILDTPPDHHALDFLTKPNVLAGFMDKKIIQWMVKPFVFAGKLGLSRVLAFGEKLMGGLAKVTGFAALHKFADFVVEMQEVIEGFHNLGTRTLQILKHPSTRFLLVSSVQQSRFFSVAQLGKELVDLGYKNPNMIINRCLPKEVADGLQGVNLKQHPALEELGLRTRGENELTEWFKTISSEKVIRIEDLGNEVDSLDSLKKLVQIVEFEL